MAEGQDETDQEDKDSNEKPRDNIERDNTILSDDKSANEDNDEVEDEDEDEDEDEEDRPHLKYLRMTAKLNAVYRNADVISTVTISGDMMVRFNIRF